MQNAAAVMKMQQPDWSGESVKRRNNTSLAIVSRCVAQMPEIKMRDRKQRCGKKVANRTETWGMGGAGAGERERGEERRSERWNKCVRFERQWAEHALKETPLPPSLLHSFPVRTSKHARLETHFLCAVSIRAGFQWITPNRKRRRRGRVGKEKSSSEHVATTQETCA